MIRVSLLLAILLALPGPLTAADKSDVAPSAIELLLLGKWVGGPCMGTWTFAADGTFAVENYSPGAIRFSGTWRVNTNALPPMLSFVCKASEEPTRIGRSWDMKIVSLNKQAVEWLDLDEQYLDERPDHYDRAKP
jgi:hypothetical protein